MVKMAYAVYGVSSKGKTVIYINLSKNATIRVHRRPGDVKFFRARILSTGMDISVVLDCCLQGNVGISKLMLIFRYAT